MLLADVKDVVGHSGGQADFDLLPERQAPFGTGCGYVPCPVFQGAARGLQRGDRLEVVPQRARRIPTPLVPRLCPALRKAEGYGGGWV